MAGWMRNGMLAACLGAAAVLATGVAQAASRTEIDTRADLVLNRLLSESATAQAVDEKAVAVLIFPDIVKAGFGLGGQYGEGVLRRDGASVAYYNIASASFGFQAGAQSYGQVIYFMTEAALRQLETSKGFVLGADANVAVVNMGANVDVNSGTLQDPIIAFVTDQKGLMAGVTVEGSKISRINPK
ncbi:MAG TPA: lipid-binding SYLF domain-containing protein [Amaricoccus sp.]|uniref:lipid-binding SYLF domain-containing protein n=1 Tax=Amaricoccus sp. TaxID=1872485 RepID=UPI002CF44D52|nr:lipid-binding SYLF domain-containing protein [Amaricoccus sp.]HPG22419.1 lipid-binding SYLF domain-containing protein [Amaricoccus sp.]HRW14222.1 lipid-binding SYLF domain-containing protein [Amaricoccus sp.]